MAVEIYVSTDIEVDGPVPGTYSMLSIGSAAFTADKSLISTFEANLETLPGATRHPRNMAWWTQQPEAWAAARTNLQPPEQAMQAYHAWLIALPGQPIFLGYPAAFDFMFVYWYLMTFVGESPFEHSALDIRSYAMAVMKRRYSESGKHRMPLTWFDETELTHVALDDAIQQGNLFCNMLQANLYNITP
ncbi:3'-5' exoribonuclease domain-containing protein [Candidatus Entotheonella palauensis]|uniref:3'-5' exoribonuclease domain-containing protein n=1 Tax=Candidatus Entotheonella palauensis TaxID=93172 RepID=UPI000B7FA256|nr:3'-5' exoribonuclease [Candidatus Entotheonella palauensis]